MKQDSGSARTNTEGGREESYRRLLAHLILRDFESQQEGSDGAKKISEKKKEVATAPRNKPTPARSDLKIVTEPVGTPVGR